MVDRGAIPAYRVNKAIKEYIERMLISFLTLQGKSDDEYIDCPRCGHGRCLEFKCSKWHCLYHADCGYVLPSEFFAPGPADLKDLFLAIEQDLRKNKLQEFAETFGLDIKHRIASRSKKL